jgi:hypothetical protein
VCVRVESYCLLCLHCGQLNLMTVAVLIGRHGEHIKLIFAGTESIYVLHLQAHWTCIFVPTVHRISTLCDENSFNPFFHYFTCIKLGNHLIS